MEHPSFPSKVDPWLGIILAILPLSGVATLVAMYATGTGGDVVFGWIALGFIAALMFGVVWPVRYELRDDALAIRFGLVCSRVPYDRITAVTPTRSIIGSPALSMDRLHVHAGSSLGPNISPKDKDGFLRALAARAPHLQLAGDRLVGRDG